MHCLISSAFATPRITPLYAEQPKIEFLSQAAAAASYTPRPVAEALSSIVVGVCNFCDDDGSGYTKEACVGAGDCSIERTLDRVKRTIAWR